LWLPINRQKDLTKLNVCTSLQIARFRFPGLFIGYNRYPPVGIQTEAVILLMPIKKYYLIGMSKSPLLFECEPVGTGLTHK
jgi:hypothetical protein